MKLYELDGLDGYTTDWVVAESEADAVEVMVAEVVGQETWDDDYRDRVWRELPDEEPFSIREDDLTPQAEAITHPAAEWCRLRGRGYLCGRA